MPMTITVQIDGLHIVHPSGVEQILSVADLAEQVSQLDNVILDAGNRKSELENYINQINALNI